MIFIDLQLHLIRLGSKYTPHTHFYGVKWQLDAVIINGPNVANRQGEPN